MCLDRARLGKQRLEARQLQTTIQRVRDLSGMHEHLSIEEWDAAKNEATLANGLHMAGFSWARHPAAAMWRNNVLALMLYSDCIIREWVRRGYENNMPMMLARDDGGEMYSEVRDIEMPAWLGRDDFHSSHRGRLLAKDQEWYSQWGWSETPSEEYIWPTEER